MSHEAVRSVRQARLLCPSAPCAPGNQLVGIVGRNGRVAMLEQPITVDAKFVSMARLGRRPEQRFRFATPCVSRGCQHWGNERCGVSDEVSAASSLLDAAAAESSLPRCGIRASCRWFDQSGAAACASCPEVVREIVGA